MARSTNLQLDFFPGKLVTNQLHVKKSTFLGGLATRVHRWFRLTPSFGPELVQHILEATGTPKKANILDPFAGAGTTLIESKLEGHSAFGFEINPFLHFVCDTCLNWNVDPKEAERLLAVIEKSFKDRKQKLAGKTLLEAGLFPPPIHNIHRWWRDDVLFDLLLLLDVIRSSGAANTTRFFELALAGVLVPNLTNVTLGRLQLHFINRENHKIDVLGDFYSHARIMIEDLKSVQEVPDFGTAVALLTDAKDVGKVPNIPPIDRVITSPPYPNRYSYVWNTRPYLYLFGFFSGKREAGALDVDTIGGTWGTATSSLAKGQVEPKYSIVADCVEPIVYKIRKTDNLMANYIMKYFNDLAEQIVQQDRFLQTNAKLAYVVGCSRIKGEYIETDVLLGKIFDGLGLEYKTTRIERFRRRHSDNDLHESTVFVSKN